MRYVDPKIGRFGTLFGGWSGPSPAMTIRITAPDGQTGEERVQGVAFPKSNSGLFAIGFTPLSGT